MSKTIDNEQTMDGLLKDHAKLLWMHWEAVNYFITKCSQRGLVIDCADTKLARDSIVTAFKSIYQSSFAPMDHEDTLRAIHVLLGCKQVDFNNMRRMRNRIIVEDLEQAILALICHHDIVQSFQNDSCYMKAQWDFPNRIDEWLDQVTSCDIDHLPRNKLRISLLGAYLYHHRKRGFMVLD
jgi:hypothetical protein